MGWSWNGGTATRYLENLLPRAGSGAGCPVDFVEREKGGFTMADTRQVVSWALERKCAFRTGEEWFLPAQTFRQLAALRTVASCEGDRRNVGGICVTGWTTERDNAGNVHEIP